MSVHYYISTENAPFFTNNFMGCYNSKPVSGEYKVGDFIISNTQRDNIFGWVCIQSGIPGTWETIYSGKTEIPNGSISQEKISSELIEVIKDKKDPRVGELESLQTNNKNDLVNAINELKSKADEAFQSGNNVKQKLVEILIAKGVGASTSESWDTLLGKVESIGSNL